MRGMRRFIDNARLLVAALLFAAMLLLPALDAFACALEVEVQGSHDSVAASPAHDRGGDHEAGVCGHNHCHHASTHLLPHAGPPAAGAGRQLPVERLRAFALSHASDNLMRPPRA